MAELLVDIHGLGKLIDGTRLVDGVTLRLGRGEILGLTGPVGGGKTTALRMLAGLVRPDLGHGTVLGEDVVVPLSRRRGRIGYMGQRLALYPELSVIDNLLCNNPARDADAPYPRLEAVLKAMALTGFADDLAGTLANGPARRLHFAGILMNAPQLLLLDEPGAGFDRETNDLIWRAIEQVAADGGGAIVASCDMAELARCTAFVPFADQQAGTQFDFDMILPATGASVVDEALRLLAGGGGRRLAHN
ncbi:ATP-binding cassette domain-containing protein [Sphingomonas sp.]|uniref:ATP-binding cassette domain-containing protein n=1 Tax=Sphingomonas sp. TaxID=28214 RepID=UPI001D6A482A|nr:ABC transporter ATP-binding protein [Sphingomonas sp.]MBX9797506.1 ABC transporter ATP-binding protein [Sphingomonas sp.]